jgi:TRAP-type uncharacterized transport system substrate-binding protein
LSNDIVHAALKSICDNTDKLALLHPSLQEWTRERAVTLDATIPYHPAAIPFYKEKNAWPTKMDETQKRPLAMNS